MLSNSTPPLSLSREQFIWPKCSPARILLLCIEQWYHLNIASSQTQNCQLCWQVVCGRTLDTNIQNIRDKTTYHYTHLILHASEIIQKSCHTLLQSIEHPDEINILHSTNTPHFYISNKT